MALGERNSENGSKNAKTHRRPALPLWMSASSSIKMRGGGNSPLPYLPHRTVGDTIMIQLIFIECHRCAGHCVECLSYPHS